MKLRKIIDRIGSVGLITLLIFSGIGIGGLAYYAWLSVTIPFEVKEPLEILEYTSELSFYPGETKTLYVVVQNYAPINYSVQFDFHLDDMFYLQNYVTFSNDSFIVMPGTHNFTVEVLVKPCAPPADMQLEIVFERVCPDEEPEMPLNTSLMLLGSAARWAAGNGSSALYVNWKDNWLAHHSTDGENWTWGWTMESFDSIRYSISSALTYYGLDIEFAADIPESLDGYDVVVISAYYAVEPRHNSLVEEYISNGGGIVLLGGVPCYFQEYNKDLYVTNDLSATLDWFGANRYVNSGGTARITVDNPFGTDFVTGDIMYETVRQSFSAISQMSSEAEILARWDSGHVFAFTHEYGLGQVYYQSWFEYLDNPP
ncbi:MAG: hypothetical protein JSV51_03370 [Candidatus Bathyarchaeota archaeon]|nr:MAG: hypothetical protein JSV51_03370 [Candidatus Bathyarchaeota archaeon]